MSKLNIKPIETEYNGYLFRSRLEARWAVFFDAAGIEYQYETEGFVLQDGTRYLPDFYLPWFNCYVEIKPKVKKKIESGERMCKQLFRDHGDCVTMLCVGDPLNNDMRIFCCDTTDSSGGENWFEASFSEGTWWEDDCGEHGTSKHWISLIAETSRDRQFFTSDWKPASVSQSYRMIAQRNDFTHAKIIARQAKFEHRKPDRRK